MNTFVRIFKYVRRNWPTFLLSIACMIFSASVSIQIPLLTKEAIDNILPLFANELTVELGKSRLIVLALEIIGLTAVVGLFSFVVRFANTYFSQKVVYDIRNDVFASLQSQSFAFYDRTRTGQLLSKVTTDIDRVRMFLQWQLMFLVNSTITLIVALYTMLSLNVSLTLLLLLTMPFLFVTFYLFGKKIRPLYARMREEYGGLTSVLFENVTGMRVVRAFAREGFERKKFRAENDKYFKTTLDTVRVRAFYIPLIAFLIGIGTVTIFWYGGFGVIQGTLTIGALVAFNAFLAMLAMPMRFLGLFVSGYQLSMAAGERVFGIMDAEPEIKEKPGALSVPKLQGYVRLEEVSFGYEGKRQILKNVNLEVKPGETVALLGPTGSGKSTLIRLIPRFYDVSSGKITIDGYDTRDVKLESLRKQIGIVSQETFLFARTVKENIAYGKPTASMKDIIAAAKVARAHEFITSLPNGYDSMVGERGVTLSGGEQQRVAIARALLSDPKILILDDSTSSVDVETEYEIQQALQALFKNRTTFVITQRVSTMRNADKIVVLENGEIVEEGTHQSLLARNGAYYRIYQTLYEAQKPVIAAQNKRPHENRRLQEKEGQEE